LNTDTETPLEPLRKNRLDVAIDAFMVWVILILACIAAGVVLGWRAVRIVAGKLGVRGSEPDL
jgi:hypothetical protein